MSRPRAVLRRLVMVVGMIVLAGTLSGCHELWCGFVEGLTGEPIDCSHEAFPDLGDIDLPPLPPPPSLPTTSTTQAVPSTTSVPPSTTTTEPGEPTTTTLPDGETTTTTPSAAQRVRDDPEEPPVEDRTTTGTIRERVEELRQRADGLRAR